MGRLLTSVILLVVGAALGAAGMYYFVMQGGSSSSVATISFYGDWRLNCPAQSEKSAGCELGQTVTDNVTGAVIFRVGIRRGKDGEEMVIVAPLGILVQPGLGVAFGEIEPRKVDIDVCDATGCIAIFPVDDKLFSAINTRKEGALVMADFTGKLVTLPISLVGLEEALAAFRARGGNTSLIDDLRARLNAVI